MNAITERGLQVPETVDELAKFVLVIPQKIKSVRAEIKALTRVTLAEEVLEQKKKELRTLSEAYVDASVKVGELLLEIPKRTCCNYPNARKPIEIRDDSNFNKPKGQIIKEMGLTKDNASQFQMLALYPDIVEIAKTESRKSGKPLTMNRVIMMIKAHRNGCRVEAKDRHKYTKAELTDCVTWDRRAREKTLKL